MNPPKMSYFSDIDLATLHRTRLNERIQYKLSWFNRRQKYYIPSAANKSWYNRDKQSIKNSANHKVRGGNQKKSTNGVEIISEKNSLNNAQKLAANRPQKGAGISEIAPTSSSASRLAHNLNQCDNLAADVSAIDEITAHQNETKNNNHNPSITDNVVNKSRHSTLPDTRVSSPHSLASDADSVMKTNAKQSTVHAKCLSGDAIKRNAHTMTDTSTVHPPCDNQSGRAIEEDLESIPHRKRSGTWP